MQKFKATVIIPSYNDTERLKLCLDALATQSYPEALFNVIVIDNNSDVPCEPVVNQYPFATYLFEPEPGSYHARNRALAAKQLNEVVAFTDSDCVPESHWLEQGIRALASKDDQIGAVGGNVTVFPKGERPNLAELYDLVTGFDQETYIHKENFAVTANLVTWREVIEKIGLFNAELKSSGDKDWCQRMVREGYKLKYCPDAIVGHPARTSTKSIKTKLRRLYGGFYYNHLYKEKDKLFSLSGFIEALMPPLSFYKKFKKTKLVISKVDFFRLFLLAYNLKIYTLYYRFRLISNLEKNIERS